MADQNTNYKQGYSWRTMQLHDLRTAESEASFLLPLIRSDARILDVGCGGGTITVGLANRANFGHTIGVDLSEIALQKAREHAEDFLEEGHYGTIKFQVADLVAGLPFPDGTFDVVYSSQLFPHLPPPGGELAQRAVSEMRRVLREGGILATRTIAEQHWYPRSHAVGGLWTRAIKAAVGMEEWPGDVMPALLRKCGFVKMKVGAGTTVWAGEERKVFADSMAGRLVVGDSYRDSWLAAGMTEEEIEDAKKVILEWGETEDAWYVGVQSETLAWK